MTGGKCPPIDSCVLLSPCMRMTETALATSCWYSCSIHIWTVATHPAVIASGHELPVQLLSYTNAAQVPPACTAAACSAFAPQLAACPAAAFPAAAFLARAC